MAGIYIHIPFCKSRCSYCDFFSTTMLNRRKEYVNALLSEIKDSSDVLSASDIETIYFGGGTPSLLPTSLIQQLLEALPTSNTKEITLECNPGDITPDKLSVWRKMGINRLSIGIQSFNDTILKTIGRRHNAEQARQAVLMSQAAGFDNISVDIIYAIPTPKELPISTFEVTKQDIAEVLQLNVQHISTYCLTFEEGTPFYTKLLNGDLIETDEDTENLLYDYIVRQLQNAGYEHYEVSNFAIQNRHSLHNSNYWNKTPYFGFGAGAHAYDGKNRSWNVSDISLYINQALTHTLRRECEHLSDNDRYNEYIMLGLRTANGLDYKKIHNQALANQYIKQGLLQVVHTPNPHVVATLSGLHILNQIIEDLME